MRKIRCYHDRDEDQVVELWEKTNLTRPWNNPRLDIYKIMTNCQTVYKSKLLNNGLICDLVGFIKKLFAQRNEI